MTIALQCWVPEAHFRQCCSSPEPARHSPCLSTPHGIRRYQASVYERRRKRPRRFAANVSRAAGEISASEGDTPQLDVAALEGISFTPGGLLFPYYCGVSAALNDLGMISSQTRGRLHAMASFLRPVKPHSEGHPSLHASLVTLQLGDALLILPVCSCSDEVVSDGWISRLAGSSAGAIIAVFMASGLSHHDAMEAFRSLLADITEYGTVGRLGGVLRTMLLKYLPDNVAELASGRVTIGMTDFGGFQRLPFNAVLVNQFHSKDDLVDAVCASCHIPYYLGPSVGSEFRGQELSDGAVTAFLPPPIPYAEAGAREGLRELQTIGVCAVPAAALGSEFLGQRFEVHISPSLQQTPRFGFLKLSMMGLLPYSADEGDELFDLGYKDVVTWASRRLKSETVITSTKSPVL
mmetsp:Transcript_12852/g.32477  ORF Transcript_12852/g.32477 Transcript_12852/m.32477 type:complete len:407 (+) Transcript_12852:215-1435(+)